MSIQCLKMGCRNLAHITCSKCNIVGYCASECMNEDLPGHSIICRESYPDMLRAYAGYLQTCKHSNATLSYQIITNFNQKFYSIGLCKEFFCVCCKRVGLRDRDTKDNNFIGIQISNKIYYSRCEDCYEKDIRLCVNSYSDDKLCWRGVVPLMLLREYILSSNYSAGDNGVNNVIPYEIFGYILGIVGNVACLEHMFK